MAASIKCDERPFKGGSGGALPPQPKTGGSGGQRPPAKILGKNEKKNSNVTPFPCYPQYREFMDTELEERNPGAAKLLKADGYDLQKCAYQLSSVLPKVISVEFNAAASRNTIHAAVLDIFEAMKCASSENCCRCIF